MNLAKGKSVYLQGLSPIAGTCMEPARALPFGIGEQVHALLSRCAKDAVRLIENSFRDLTRGIFLKFETEAPDSNQNSIRSPTCPSRPGNLWEMVPKVAAWLSWV